MESSFSSRPLADVASAIAKLSRSTSALADFIFWPETANCSVNAAIRASDSFNLERATSKRPCLESTSLCAVTISNLRRSQLWLRVSNFSVKSWIRAFISIRDVEEVDPPRARLAVMTSPSRVTTVSPGFDRKIASASRALSTTTVDPRSEESKSLISEDLT